MSIIQSRNNLDSYFFKFLFKFLMISICSNYCYANDDVIKFRIISGDAAIKLKQMYKEKYKLGSLILEMEIIHVIEWKIGNNYGDILFKQWGNQCRVSNYIKMDSGNVKIMQLMDTPCILSKSTPIIQMKPQVKITYEAIMIERRSYDGEYFLNESIQEIIFNEKSGKFCSDSSGNIDDMCLFSMSEDKYK